MNDTLTIEQIAQLAHVSRSTVSRVLNSHPSVRPLVRDRVLRIMAEHDYTPRAAARSLARRRTNLIGIIISEKTSFVFSTQFFSGNIEGINRVCLERGYFPMVSMLMADTNAQVIKDVMQSHHFDGVILYDSDANAPLLDIMHTCRVPVVSMGRHVSEPQISWVSVTDEEGAYTATTHLIGLGHRTIGFIAGPPHMLVARDRQAGYERAVREAGMPVDPTLIAQGDLMTAGGYTAMTQLLARDTGMTAVFTSNDPTAYGAMHALQTAGLRVPDDMALVGFDDLPASATTIPRLTTIHQPIVEQGAAAATMLIDQFEQHGQPQHVLLPVHLVVRDSCGAQPRQQESEIADPYVSHSLRTPAELVALSSWPAGQLTPAADPLFLSPAQVRNGGEAQSIEQQAV